MQFPQWSKTNLCTFSLVIQYPQQDKNSIQLNDIPGVGEQMAHTITVALGWSLCAYKNDDTAILYMSCLTLLQRLAT